MMGYAIMMSRMEDRQKINHVIYIIQCELNTMDALGF